MCAKAAEKIQPQNKNSTGKDLLHKFHGNEIFVAIVGPAGAGAGTAAARLDDFLADIGFETKVIKASKLIKTAALNAGLEVPPDGRKSLTGIETMQNRGDDLRQGSPFNTPEDHTAVARLIIEQIRIERAGMQGKEYSKELEVEPDNKKRAYIIDSLRHPAEVHLLRRVYQDSFFLIGIVCDPQVRERRIIHNLFDRNEWANEETQKAVRKFLRRDEDAPDDHGQHVADTFHEADFFVDNSEEGGEDLKITGMNDALRRFVSLISHNKIIRPTVAETAMHQARSAQMRSACLSRQVGAALVDQTGNIVSTGTNEVPKAGGGVYGQSFNIDASTDCRCAFRETVFCSSNKQQNEIIEELIDTLPRILNHLTLDAGESGIEKMIPNLIRVLDKNKILKEIRGTRIGGLIEFSRAVHAEMDAILSAALSGVSPKGCRLYVTTYPCHYCARHIVAAGIDEVQFIEPYPKSKAIKLHSDAITTESVDWLPPSARDDKPSEKANQHKVLFKPFVGVSPRMYRRVFLKDRPYKDKITGEQMIGTPTWGAPSDSYKISYISLEKELGINASNE